MAFVEALITDCDADVVMVDRRADPGVRLIPVNDLVKMDGPASGSR
jgi:hypothetical protein